ncbi:MAG: mechanosensitive ion channel family protein [Candidatus Pacebacteria bacterium]|nr:mechanosensitive ion channel family protein [Candidatus Paceibacterota bacterium]
MFSATTSQGISVFGLLGIQEPLWWQYELFNNSIGDYIMAVCVLVVFLAVFKLFQIVVLYRLGLLAKKTKTDIDDTLVEIVKSLRPPFYSFLAVYTAVQFLTLSVTLQKVFDVLLIVWVIYQAIIATQILIEYIFTKTLKEDTDAGIRGALGMVKAAVKGVLWAVGILMILSNLGVDVTALVAGLGIGGIAIAFAFQNILEDLFSSFAILFDKPFQIGDFIIIGDKKGTVQKIGIKTTRIKSSQGEEIVISNKEITSAQVQNFKKMEERRIAFSLGVTYETPTEKLKKVSGMIKEIIDNVECTRFDRAHFKSFDDCALTFETVYYVETGDYAQYMDIQQDINFKIREAFELEGIDMAYPTQTIYLQK